MRSSNIFSEIKANLEFYSNVEKKIAEKILHSPEQFIEYSIGDLAKEIEISQGSVNNFAKKVIGSGFAALKLQVAQQLASYSEKSFETVVDGDSAKDVLQKTMGQMNEAYENTFALNSEEAIERVANRILNAKKIEIYGVFLSSQVAENLRYQLLQLGFSVEFVEDVLLCQISASMLKSDSLVIAVSSSGKTKDIIDAVNIAKENHVPIVAITANVNSPLAKVSDEVLVAASSGTNVSNDMYERQFSKFLLVNAICSYIRHLIDKDGTNQYYKLKDILDSHSIEG
ncbi:MAG: MurR/RpiR family transcriptional regulator [Tyzzerella sp.]|nr:MurR/RpiR family transcriptional regulator [Tyzzerella sp.]